MLPHTRPRRYWQARGHVVPQTRQRGGAGIRCQLVFYPACMLLLRVIHSFYGDLFIICLSGVPLMLAGEDNWPASVRSRYFHLYIFANTLLLLPGNSQDAVPTEAEDSFQCQAGNT